MAMYNKFITFLMLTFIVSISFAQQYTPMTAAGYQYKRAKVDSTLHIPSFCGVPNLRNSTAIQGALAMDTCANKLYQWTHAAGWSTISTNAIDSLKRSNDSIFARKSGVWVFQYKDSVGGGGTPSLQDVATVGNYYINDYGDTLKLNSYDGNNKHPLLWVNDQYNPVNILDFSYNTGFNQNVASIKFGDSTNTLATGYIKITDKESYFRNELSERTIIQNTPSISGSNQITYFPLMKNGTDTLATTEDIRNSAIDTANKWVNNIYRTSGVDSIYYTIGSTTYAIKDSAGGGSSQNGRFGNDTATIVMAKVHNNSGVQLTNGKVVAFSTSGTSSDAPSVKLANNKADSTSANTFGFVSGTIAINDTGWVILSGKIEKLNTSAFANGDIIYLDSISGGYTKTKPVAPYHQVYLGTVVKANAGNGSIYVKVINGLEIEELHDVQITSKQNNQIIVYSDTQQLWKNRSIYSVVDTTNKIATKTNLALKVNISDTSSMLTPYLRSNTASATYLAKSDSTTYYTKYRSDTSRTNIYNAINGKQAAGTYVTSVSGTSPISSSGGTTPAISISQASTSTNGYLSSTDWNTFNGKIGASDTSVFLRKTDSATYYTKYRSDTSRTNIYNALNGKQGTLTLTTTGTSGASTLVGNTLNIPQYSGGTVGGVAGNIQYNDGTTFAGSNNLFWDNTNTRLGIAQSTPTSRFHLNFNQNSVTQSDANGILLANSTAAIAGTQSISPAIVWRGNGWKTTATAASQDVRFRADVLPVQGTTNPNASWRLSTSVNGGAYVDRMTVTTTGATANGVVLDVMSGTSNGIIRSDYIQASSTVNATDQFLGGNATSGSFSYRTTNAGGFIIPKFSTYNTAASGTLVHSIDNTNGFVLQAANAAGNYIARASMQITSLTNTTGSESGDLIFLTQSGGTAMSEKMRIFGGGNIGIGTSTDAGFKLDVNGAARVQGALNFNPTNTAAGTTGNQTINKASGTVNIAAAGTTVTVTNNLVTASSIVFAVIRTNDATATIKNVVPASGSFTINLNAATTAETSIGFFVIN